MSQNYFAMLTEIGENKFAQATALGKTLNLSEIGVGDGGGQNPIPDRMQTKLINEVRRKPLNQLKIDPQYPDQIIAEQVIPESEGGWWIREIGLYDSEGDLCAVANAPPTYKPILSEGSGRIQVIRMLLRVNSTDNVALMVDPSVVMATQNFVHHEIKKAIDALDFKNSVRVASTKPITLSGLQKIDNIMLAPGDRILVTAQNEATHNGLYIVNEKAWVRAEDANEINEINTQLMVLVEEGKQEASTLWQLNTPQPIILDKTPLTFEKIGGETGVLPGTYSRITVDKLGRVIAGSNATTLAGYGISDAAPLHNPVFSGAPQTPTPPIGDNSLRLATTAFVQQLVDAAVKKATPRGIIGVWRGTENDIPSDWALCDGTRDTPDLRDRFIVGAGGGYAVASTGGAALVALSEAQLPSHTHTAWTDAQGNHQHTGSTDAQGHHQHSYSGHVKAVPFAYAGGGGNPGVGMPSNSAGVTDATGQHSHSFTTSETGQHTHAIGINATGNGHAHENRPPYYALCFIMKL